MIYKKIISIIIWSALCFNVSQAEIQPEIVWEQPSQLTEEIRSILLSVYDQENVDKIKDGKLIIGYANLDKEPSSDGIVDKEIIVHLPYPFCGSGGCTSVILKKITKNKYSHIFGTVGANDIKLNTKYTNGMLDLFVYERFWEKNKSNAEMRYNRWYHYKWNGKYYEQDEKNAYMTEQLKIVYPNIYNKIEPVKRKRQLEEDREWQAEENKRKAAVVAAKKRELEEKRHREKKNKLRLDEEKRKQDEYNRKLEEKRRLEEEKIGELKARIASHPFWSFDIKYETSIVSGWGSKKNRPESHNLL